MNIRELEAFLVEIVTYFESRGEYEVRAKQALLWVRAQQRAKLRRKSHFKHRADEQRELLR
jgi:hypothetical protein